MLRRYALLNVDDMREGLQQTETYRANEAKKEPNIVSIAAGR
jgi:hypothetical protein